MPSLHLLSLCWENSTPPIRSLLNILFTDCGCGARKISRNKTLGVGRVHAYSQPAKFSPFLLHKTLMKKKTKARTPWVLPTIDGGSNQCHGGVTLCCPRSLDLNLPEVLWGRLMALGVGFSIPLSLMIFFWMVADCWWPVVPDGSISLARLFDHVRAWNKTS